VLYSRLLYRDGLVGHHAGREGTYG
jgi:hypothetical protein